MKPNFAQPHYEMGSDVVWIDANPAVPAADDEALTISQMAARFDVTPRALRFYESKGLLAPARAGRSRIYKREDQQHLALVLKGRKLGFTITEISLMIAVEEGRVTPQALKMTREK
jgi:DNA-binding transcriptional MerR regulator